MRSASGLSSLVSFAPIGRSTVASIAPASSALTTRMIVTARYRVACDDATVGTGAARGIWAAAMHAH